MRNAAISGGLTLFQTFNFVENWVGKSKLALPLLSKTNWKDIFSQLSITSVGVLSLPQRVRPLSSSFPLVFCIPKWNFFLLASACLEVVFEITWRAKLISAPLGMPKRVWPSMNYCRYRYSLLMWRIKLIIWKSQKFQRHSRVQGPLCLKKTVAHISYFVDVIVLGPCSARCNKP